MAFEVVDKYLNGLVLIKPDVYMDDRGFFMESFRSDMIGVFMDSQRKKELVDLGKKLGLID